MEKIAKTAKPKIPMPPSLMQTQDKKLTGGTIFRV